MLAADPDLQVGVGSATQLHGGLYQLADPLPVQNLEGVLREDSLLNVLQEELLFGVVAADAEGGLCQVVGAEAEELGVRGDLIRREGGPGSSIMVPIL